MKIALILFSVALGHWAPMLGQCNTCAPVSGEIIDFCYTLPEVTNRCASFSEGSPYFHFETRAGKKTVLLKFDLPTNGIGPDSRYLLGLNGGKIVDLTTSDILFIQQAVKTWTEIAGITSWEHSVISSGYTLHSSGLAYKVLIPGTGDKPIKGQTMVVHYSGYLEDGTPFDSSINRHQPFRFVLGESRVISGWEEGVALMPIGSRYFFKLPPDLAYGSKGAGDVIPPYATLYFDVQLLAVE
jgi:hypothetical protein